MRRIILLAITVLLLSAGSAKSPSQPNVIFIMIDDMGCSDLACYGSDLHETPHIDGLAKGGMFFENAYSAAAICSPTRASLLSGKPPVSTGITEHIRGREFQITEHHELIPAENGKGLKLEEVTIAEILKKQGYHTAVVGKWHLGGDEFHASKQGFDHVVAANHRGGPGSYFYPYANTKPDLINNEGDEDYLTDRITKEAISFVDQNKDKPFFLYLSYFAVHIPLQAKEELYNKYEKKIANTHPTYHKNARYAAMVETVDTNVGALMSYLEAEGLRENTLIIITSDNGGLSVQEGDYTPATNNYPCRAGKGFLYEGGIKVPLIINWEDKIAAGSHSKALVSTYDYLSTISAVCGVKTEMPYTQDISPIFLHNKTQEERSLYWYAPHYSNQGGQPGAVIRRGNYKLIHYFGAKGEELYDLEKDKSERHNLVLEKPKVRQQLSLELMQWLKDTDAKRPVANPNYKK